MDVWSDLAPLRMTADIRAEMITYGVLWELLGGMPGPLVFTTKLLQEHFARDASSLRAHVEKLARLGLIRLKARDRCQGTFFVHVLLPLPCHAQAKVDKQMKFPLEWDAGVELDAWMREHIEETADGQGGRIAQQTAVRMPSGPAGTAAASPCPCG